VIGIVFVVVLPVFLVIGAGYAATRSGVLRAGGIADSNAWRTVRRCT